MRNVSVSLLRSGSSVVVALTVVPQSYQEEDDHEVPADVDPRERLSS